MERKKSEGFIMKVYFNETEILRRRGRPFVKLKDRMKELLIEG